MVIDLTKNQPKEEQQKMSFEKTEEIAIINRNVKGWTVELNKISYNGRDPVYDLRSWSPDGRMGKGMTLTDQTLENLLIVLKAHLEGELPREEKEEENELEARLPQDFE
ncbi:YdbC family protein [Enterococcus faecalis]